MDIRRSKSRTRKAHLLNLEHEAGRDQHSPYWQGTILHTIPEWNKLIDSTVKADLITGFKSQLATTP